MTIDESIKKYIVDAECNRTNGDLRGWLESKQLAKWLKELKEVKQIIAQNDADSMPEDSWYIDKIREVVGERTKKFIVTEKQILKAVETALELNIQDPRIVDIFMNDVENQIEAVLYDDCEEYKEESEDK